MSKLIFLEFNEINFDFIEEYAEKHPFPNFRRFIDAHGLCKTTSEHEFHKLEPWIQWVTAHTGLDADKALLERMNVPFADVFDEHSVHSPKTIAFQT